MDGYRGAARGGDDYEGLLGRCAESCWTGRSAACPRPVGLRLSSTCWFGQTALNVLQLPDVNGQAARRPGRADLQKPTASSRQSRPTGPARRASAGSPAPCLWASWRSRASTWPMSIEGVVVFMRPAPASAATHSIVLARWFQTARCATDVLGRRRVAVITSDGQFRGWQALPPQNRSPTQGRCLAGRLRLRQNVIVVKRTGADVAMVAGLGPGTATRSPQSDLRARWVEAEHPLFILHLRAPPASPRGVRSSGGCCAGRAVDEVRASTSSNDVFLVHRRHRLGDRHPRRIGPLACVTRSARPSSCSGLPAGR